MNNLRVFKSKLLANLNKSLADELNQPTVSKMLVQKKSGNPIRPKPNKTPQNPVGWTKTVFSELCTEHK